MSREIETSAIVKILDDGKVTIPKNIREAWNLKKGDLIEIRIVRKIEQEVTA